MRFIWKAWFHAGILLINGYGRLDNRERRGVMQQDQPGAVNILSLGVRHHGSR